MDSLMLAIAACKHSLTTQPIRVGLIDEKLAFMDSRSECLDERNSPYFADEGSGGCPQSYRADG